MTRKKQNKPVYLNFAPDETVTLMLTGEQANLLEYILRHPWVLQSKPVSWCQQAQRTLYSIVNLLSQQHSAPVDELPF